MVVGTCCTNNTAGYSVDVFSPPIEGTVASSVIQPYSSDCLQIGGRKTRRSRRRSKKTRKSQRGGGRCGNKVGGNYK